MRAQIAGSAYPTESTRRYPLVSYCPVDVYRKHSSFGGDWPSAFCEMITIKAKLVAKYYHEISKYRERADAERKGKAR